MTGLLIKCRGRQRMPMLSNLKIFIFLLPCSSLSLRSNCGLGDAPPLIKCLPNMQALRIGTQHLAK